MSENWDFSSLLASWTEKSTENQEQETTNNNEFAEIQEQMQKELDEIQSQFVLVRSNDPRVLNELNLLTPPMMQPPQIITEQPEVQNQNSKQVSSRATTSLASISAKNKNSISKKNTTSKLPPLNKSSLGNLPKPKESMLMKPRKAVVQKVIPKPEKIFKATPSELRVVNFTLSKEYTLTFTLQNVSSRTRGFQINGPQDPSFRYRIIENVNNSQIRPGLHLTFEVTFVPTEPRDYEGSIIINPGPNDQPTAIPIRCYRDPPQLVLNDIVDLQATLVHSSKSGSFTITNRGGVASFSLSSAHGREESTDFVCGPFTLSPSKFQLERGQSVEISIKFKPTTVGLQKASFEINAQFFPQKFFFIAQGFAAVPRLRFKICDSDRLFLPFLPADVNTSRSIEIYNDSDVSYPFYIQIVRPKESTKSQMKDLFSDTKTETVKSSPPFSVKPLSGFIGARDTIALNVNFSPKMFAFFRANLVIFAHRIPDESGTLGSRKMLTIATEATAGPPRLFIQPPLLLFHDIIPRVPCKQFVDIVNDSFLNIKLQWRKSEVITPSPVILEIEPKQNKNVELCFLLSKYITSPLADSNLNQSSIFLNNLKIEQRYSTAGGKRNSNSGNKGSSEANSRNENRSDSHPSSQNYAIIFSPLSKQQSTPNDNNNMNSSTINENANNATSSNDKNLSTSRLKKSLSLKESRNAISPSSKSENARDDQANRNVSKLVDQTPIDVNQIPFTFSAKIKPPNLVVEPPVLDFGCVLSGLTGTQKVRLINPTDCPIGYSISYPQTGEWKIDQSQGIVEKTTDLTIDLTFDEQTTLTEIITINTFWIGEDGNQIKSLPTSFFDVPVYAVFDKPFLSIEKRVIDIGDVFPTIEYKSKIKISLLNTFPTNFSFDNYSNIVSFTTRPLSIEQKSDDALISNRGSAPISIRSKSQVAKNSINSDKNSSKVNQRPSTVTLKQRSEKHSLEENGIEEEENVNEQPKLFNFVEYVKTDPAQGKLELNDSCEINVASNFSKIGDIALPFVCNVTGNSYTCAVVAHVHPPKLTLKTPMIDFSSDFVICRKSVSFVIVENECGVPSTAKLEMVDDCNGVFSLDDTNIKEVLGNEKVEIPISCYSEIHGNYNGKIKLIIKDSWQRNEILIPLHVKALGSFFGFMKHTLGYTVGSDGDVVSFGDKIKLGSQKIIRRITLENFSSDQITVDWSISNMVKGRHYVDFDIDIDQSGSVKLAAAPTNEADVMEPFKLLTNKSVIDSHSKTVVVVEFTPNELGTFRGCIAAKSGEFTHTLDLIAIVRN